jgi:protocatechuate 3,4-dioxygenase beta subunit
MAVYDANFSPFSRRVFLLTGAAALSRLKAFPATPGCTLTPEQEQGPYYVDDEVVRQDITEGKPGLPLKLRISLVDSVRCVPLSGVALDIWHCDALGVYSAFAANSPDGFGGPGGPGPGRRGMPPPGFPDGLGPEGSAPYGPPPDGFGPAGPRSTDASRFLRGVQLTDKRGLAEFVTLYPGWYFGRAVHVHLKAHLGGAVAGGKYAGGHVSHTGQLFLPEDVTAEVARLQPYAQRLSVHRTLQPEDIVFTRQHGAASMVSLDRVSRRSKEDGFVATVTLAINPEATPAPVGFGGRGGPPPFNR